MGVGLHEELENTIFCDFCIALIVKDLQNSKQDRCGEIGQKTSAFRQNSTYFSSHRDVPRKQTRRALIVNTTCRVYNHPTVRSQKQQQKSHLSPHAIQNIVKIFPCNLHLCRDA
jgi:hypothetical protein